MQFADIIGQAPIKQSIRQMIDSDRLPHSVLLLGPEGSGNLATALATARYLLCSGRTAGDDEACGSCSNCQKTLRYVHPDLHFSFPTIGTNVTSDKFLPEWRASMQENPYLNLNDWLQHIGAENKQGNINKEECVQIIRKISLKTFEASYKVLIIWMPELLGNEGNRLLKLIEEPPAQTVFLFVAENSERILGTILSRCQLIRFQPLTDEEVCEALQSKAQISADKALAAAALAAGNYNQALQFAREEENDHAQRFLNWLRACYKGHGVELVEQTDLLAGLGRENQKQFLYYGLHFLRSFLRLKVAPESTLGLRPQELETAKKMLPVIGLQQISPMVSLLTNCSYHIERNANPKVLFLHTGVRLHYILKPRKTA